MKTIDEIKLYLKDDSRFCTWETMEHILYWLLGKGLITETEEIEFANKDDKKKLFTFDEFIEWYESDSEKSSDLEDMPQWLKKFADDFTAAITSINDFVESSIRIGDYVKVHDIDNPRSEYVEYISYNQDGKKVYCLSDGSWDTCVSKYKVQGEERKVMIDKLNEVYND